MHAGARRRDMGGSETDRAAGKRLSLRARALKLLMRRDHSYAELKRKLAPHASEDRELDALLAEFQRLGWLSEPRFAEEMVRKAAARFGASKVIEQLQERGVDRALAAELESDLRASEFQRAQALWQKRFGFLPADLRERARQARFLEQRGFDPNVIRRVLGGTAEE